MELKQVVETIGLAVKAGEANLNSEVTGGYICDLLSDVIGNSQKGQLWITMQVHPNIVAVATLKELAGIVLIGSKEPADATVAKAADEGVPLLTTSLSAYELAGRMWDMGLHGSS